MHIRQHIQRLVGIAALLAATVACNDTTGPGEQELRLQVAPESVACTPWYGPSTCLRVRELVGGDAWGSWSALYEHIDGFAHQPGFTYELVIARKFIPNPPADGSSYSYRLIKVVSKVFASPLRANHVP